MALLLLEYATTSPNYPMIVMENTSFFYGKAYIVYNIWGFIFRNRQDLFSSNSTSSSVLNIVDSKFVGNYAERNGGGAYLQWKQSLTTMERIVDIKIVNSEFSGNSIGVSGSGRFALHYQSFIDYTNDPHVFPKYRVNLNFTNGTCIPLPLPWCHITTATLWEQCDSRQVSTVFRNWWCTNGV